MRRDDAFSEVNLDVALGRDPRAQDDARRIDEQVFRVAVCGDLGARSAGAGRGVASTATWRVDRDDFDDVLASIAPTLRLDLGNGVVADVTIRELDDFHPDRLFERVPQFVQLRELRSRLADPTTFRRAAADLAAPPRAPAPAPPPATPIVAAGGSLLDAIVGTDAPASRGGGAGDDLQAFIQRVMAPHLVDRPDPRQGELLAQLDRSITAVMRALLHHPHFQAAESLWRGIERLVRSVDTNEKLQLHLVDLTREELAADLTQHSEARETALYRRLATSSAQDEDGGWAVLVAHFAFGENGQDVALLERLAEVGAALDAPWIAEAHPSLATASLDEESLAAWQRLRVRPAARHLGLALPRVLLRLPYGREGDQPERFAFEELESPDVHGSYLWGNPALCCAALLATGFAERGSGLAVGASSLIEGLPLHVVRRAGETITKPCAEVVMGESDAIALLEAGFIAMLSYRDQNVVRVSRIQSVAEPPTRLAGRLA